MGRTPKPLRILHIGLKWEELTALVTQGHTVDDANTIVFGDGRANFADYDIILGPTCWLMDDAHRKYVKDAIAEARRRRYPKEAREQPE
jgi:hypothetical protein